MSNAFDRVEADAKSDANVLIADARAAAKAEAETAKTTATKLLQIAAGDTTQLLTEGEQAAVQVVIAKVPEPFRSTVQTFGTAALNSSLATVNAEAKAEVAKGLAYAEALLAHDVAAFEHAIGA